MTTATSPATPAPEPAAAIPPRPRAYLSIIILRALLLLALTLGLTLIVDLFLLSAVIPRSNTIFERLVTGRNAFEAGLSAAFAIFVITMVIFGSAVQRLPLRTLRGWIYLGLVALGTLVANFVLFALFPSALDGFQSVAVVAFAQSNRLPWSLIIFTFVVVGIVARLIRPPSIRSALVLFFFTWLVLAFEIILASNFPGVRQSREQSLNAFVLATVLVGLVPLLISSVLDRLRRRSWWLIGGGYLALAPVLVYLATDDAVIRRPMTMEEIAPAFPGAERSYEVLMRYSKSRLLAQDFKIPPQKFYFFSDPAKIGPWKAELLARRHEVEAQWAAMTPFREWWAELDAFDRIGDLTPGRMEADIPSYQPIRYLTANGCTYAALRAMDGHGDEAVDILVPILHVSRTLQSSARTLVRHQLALVGERAAMNAINFVLDQATISPASRERLIAALSAPGGGAAGARRLMAIEYTISVNATLDWPLGDKLAGATFTELTAFRREFLNAIGPFVYNPRATYNLYGEFTTDLQELFANRQLRLAEARANKFLDVDTRPHFKNFTDGQVLHLIVPVYTRIGETYWRTQDARAALLARLNKL